MTLSNGSGVAPFKSYDASWVFRDLEVGEATQPVIVDTGGVHIYLSANTTNDGTSLFVQRTLDPNLDNWQTVKIWKPSHDGYVYKWDNHKERKRTQGEWFYRVYCNNAGTSAAGTGVFGDLLTNNYHNLAKWVLTNARYFLKYFYSYAEGLDYYILERVLNHRAGANVGVVDWYKLGVENYPNWGKSIERFRTYNYPSGTASREVVFRNDLWTYRNRPQVAGDVPVFERNLAAIPAISSNQVTNDYFSLQHVSGFVAGLINKGDDTVVALVLNDDRDELSLIDLKAGLSRSQATIASGLAFTPHYSAIASVNFLSGAYYNDNYYIAASGRAVYLLENNALTNIGVASTPADTFSGCLFENKWTRVYNDRAYPPGLYYMQWKPNRQSPIYWLIASPLPTIEVIITT